MDRKLLVARLVDTLSHSIYFAVGTAHFESLSSAEIRKKQLIQAGKILSSCHAPSVLCGDFNFDSSRYIVFFFFFIMFFLVFLCFFNVFSFFFFFPFFFFRQFFFSRSL